MWIGWVSGTAAMSNVVTRLSSVSMSFETGRLSPIDAAAAATFQPSA